MTQPISTTLRNLTETTDRGEAQIIAGIINLYIDSLKKIHGAGMLQAGDVINIGQIVDIMFAPRQQDFKPKAKPVDLEGELANLQRRE